MLMGVKLMDKKWEIIFSGIGGQGLVLSGKILGAAAAIIEKKHAVMTCSYGTEARGTFTKSDIIISETSINFLEVLSPDVVIALAQVAYDKYVNKMKDGSAIIYNSDQVQYSTSKAKQYGLPMNNIANQAKNPIGINIVALGALIAYTKCTKPGSIKAILAKQFVGKSDIIKKNERVFDLGFDNARQLIC